jgi:hypothetical protein
MTEQVLKFEEADIDQERVMKLGWVFTRTPMSVATGTLSG